MSKVQNYFSYLPKKTIAIALALFGTLLISATVLAGFGPNRPTLVYYDGIPGFDHVTFNSFTDVPNIGDERAFFTGKISGAPSGFYDPMVFLQDGDTVRVRVYIHNNADASLNASGDGIAEDVVVKIDYDEDSLQTEHVPTAYISSDDADPVSIWDTLNMSAENGGKFELEPVIGSGEMTTNSGTTPIDVLDLVGNGVNIGDIYGCFEYTAVVAMSFEVNMPEYEVEKSVRLEGQTSNDWEQSKTVDSEQVVEYKIEFTNVGSTDLDSVIIRDDLPEYVTYVPGSTILFNSTYPNGKNMTSDNVVTTGINIGNYAPGANAVVGFKAIVDADSELECNTNRLTNLAFAQPARLGRVSDGADVVVEGEICTTEEPVYKCDGVQITKLGGKKVKVQVSTTTSADVTVTNYGYNFGDGNTLDSTDDTVTHTYSKVGNYVVSVAVTFEIDDDGQITEQTVQCKSKVSFDKEVCKYNSNLAKNDPDCKPTPELPNTGPGSFIAALFGTSTLGTAIRGWIRSRKELLSIG